MSLARWFLYWGWIYFPLAFLLLIVPIRRTGLHMYEREGHLPED